ncbi:heme NO-binding domain-containing protein [Thalassolituus alkanivorans]|uniref:heme NO-binding domain-containing protein n=1 Tax=Thalassolituus alkanivorans TaxID=2881055 RepID=UPI001E65931D|nr:heme NO-binding domain-containing protein [Thalassolituus alkanivorans]MCB2385067.1 heme NO-binding domain-containing protein [Thalassolituus alkanivorans]MCB2423348.1 heme NO-binding domain-containing protein [Thalassolituus alkanivorans]
MKGVVFDILRDMVEEQFGLAGWNALLDKAGADGLYISTQTYPDEELLKLVAAASEVTGKPADELVFSFGEFMVKEFYKCFPGFFDNASGLIDFLISVDRIVHVEVRKLYPDAALPSFTYEGGSSDEVTMNYRSPRKLCRLAEGLIAGSAEHFGEKYQLQHDPCMHRGADCCSLHIKLER